MKRRSIHEVPNLPEATLTERIMGIRNKRMKAYACFVYLFGNRVSEGIGLPMTVNTGGHYTYYKTLKKRDKKGNAIIKTIKIPKNEIVRDEKGEIKYEVQPLEAWKVSFNEEDRILTCDSVSTFKTAGRPLRQVWVLVDGPGEKVLVEFLWDFVKKIRLSEGENAVLFPLKRQSVYRCFRHYIGINGFPHKLRDLRATKDATTYGLDAKDLQEKFNWSRPDMAMYYGRKNKTDIIAKMKKNI